MGALAGRSYNTGNVLVACVLVKEKMVGTKANANDLVHAIKCKEYLNKLKNFHEVQVEIVLLK